jgi:hypothetical protein
MNEEKIICDICGFENEPGSIFCGECGAKLTKQAETTAETEVETPAETEATAEVTEAAETPTESETEAPAETTETAETPVETETTAEAEAETPAESETEATAEATETAETTEAVEPETPAETEAETPAEPEAETPTEPEPPKAKKSALKLSKKALLIIGGSVLGLLIIAAMIAIAVNFSGGVYLKEKNSPVYLYSSDSTQGAVLGYSNETWVIEKDKDDFTNIQTSADGSASLVIAMDGDDAVIYYISDKVQEIIDVPDYAKCEISANGNAFVYVSGTERNEYTITLYRDGKTEVLTEEAENGAAVCISPNGSAVSWGEDFDYGDYTFTTMLYMNSAIDTLGKSLDVYGISDNAKNVYYQKGDGIYAQKGFDSDSRIKIASAEYSPYFIFNNDLSQAIVVASDDSKTRSYFYESGKDAVKLGNDELSLLTPGDYYGVTDLKKAFYYSYDSGFDIYGLDRELKPYKIVSGVDSFALSPDGKELLYLKRDKLYRIATSDKDNKETELIDDVQYFSVSDDCKNIYFSNEDGELYYLKGADKAEAVSYDFDFDVFYVKDSSVYYIEGTEVFKGEKGKGKLVGELDYNAKDISAAYVNVTDNGTIIVEVYDDDWNTTAFISADGKNFVNIDDM